MKNYHKDTISPRCAMKIDIAKDFDLVEWEFIVNTLRAMEFPTQFIHWIKLCIKTASFSVQVNGELAGYFGSKRGLRQGCSLYPYLFVICMNVLSRKLDKAAQDHVFNNHPECDDMKLTHLCFVDDLMIFVDGNKELVEGLLEIFDAFAQRSGLCISIEKSTIYMACMEATTKAMILERFPFGLGELLVKYLGLPLMSRKMTSSDYLPLIEKIWNMISSCTVRPLPLEVYNSSDQFFKCHKYLDIDFSFTKNLYQRD